MKNLDKMLGFLEVKKLTIAKMSVHVLVPVWFDCFQLVWNFPKLSLSQSFVSYTIQ